MPTKLITIENFPDAITANIAKGKLESEGIHCFLEDKTTINTLGFNIMPGGVNLIVKEKDEEEARKILKEEIFV